MIYLLPRLRNVSDALIEMHRYFESGAIRGKFDDVLSSDLIEWAPTGGNRINHWQLSEIRNEIIRIADQFDYSSGRKVTNDEKNRFDTEVTSWIASSDFFASGDALIDEVWSFLSCYLLPDIVEWRFSRDSADRFLGGVRNTFQRLWLRGVVLDRGAESADRWGLVRELTEDAFVQILERPSIGANKKISRALAESWVRVSSEIGRGRMESLMRQVALMTRLQNQVRDLSFLSEERLVDHFQEIFMELASGHSKSKFVSKHSISNVTSDTSKWKIGKRR